MIAYRITKFWKKFYLSKRIKKNYLWGTRWLLHSEKNLIEAARGVFVCVTPSIFTETRGPWEEFSLKELNDSFPLLLSSMDQKKLERWRRKEEEVSGGDFLVVSPLLSVQKEEKKMKRKEEERKGKEKVLNFFRGSVPQRTRIFEDFVTRNSVTQDGWGKRVQEEEEIY